MTINLSKLSTKNLATLGQRLIGLSESGNHTVLTNHPLLTGLITSYQNYDSVYAKLIFSGKGADVAQADKARDVAYNNLKAFLNGYRKMNLLANYQDAEALYRVFISFGLKLNSMSYSEETAQLKKLLEALEKPENVQHLANLSLEKVVADLKTKHLAFETIFAQQVEANGALRKMDSATTIRKDLEGSVRTFLNLIKAMKNVPDWLKVYYDVNEIVKAAKNSNTTTNNHN